MQRRKFSREFKVEEVRLVKEREVAVAQAAHDLNVYENVLRKWVREFAADKQDAFPGHGQLKRGARGDSAPAPGSGQAQGGARYSKKRSPAWPACAR